MLESIGGGRSEEPQMLIRDVCRLVFTFECVQGSHCVRGPTDLPLVYIIRKAHLLGGGRILVHDPSLLEDLRPLTIDVHLPDIHLGLDAEMGG